MVGKNKYSRKQKLFSAGSRKFQPWLLNVFLVYRWGNCFVGTERRFLNGLVEYHAEMEPSKLSDVVPEASMDTHRNP